MNDVLRVNGLKQNLLHRYGVHLHLLGVMYFWLMLNHNLKVMVGFYWALTNGAINCALGVLDFQTWSILE